MRQTVACVGFGSFAGGVRKTEPVNETLDLQVVRRSDNNDAIDAAAPVGKYGFALAAPAGIALRLKDERRDDDGDSSWIALKDLVQPPHLNVNDGGMDGGFQFIDPATTKGQFGEMCAVKLAIGAYDFIAEDAHDFIEDGLA